MQDRLKNSNFFGEVRLYSVADAWTPLTEFKPNLIVFDWTKIGSRLLAGGDAAYRIAGMYIEFENVADPAVPVTVPGLDRTRNLDYYTNLSGNRDYLRVPLTAHTVNSAASRSDNAISFFAQTSGLFGMRGETFSSSDNSVVFGASLVAMPSPGDKTRDVIFSSFYLTVPDQMPKLPTSQLGLEWRLTLS